MKYFISFIVLLVMLSLNSCTSEAPVSPEIQKGGITLNIDRAHKPANVAEVTAYLTREGHEEISGTLNLLSDTTADITFNDIAAGQWHLKVDAADADSVVVYTGEKGVEILAGITTQVYLTLVPTGNGEGNIYINVTWGVPQNTNWIDYENNPIITQSIISDYPGGVIEPKIIYEDGIYKMWVTSLYNSAVTNIWYLVSNDGINWQLGQNSPVLTPGNGFGWDSHAVGSAAVIKDDNEYKMYFTGYANQYEYWNIGLATSSDGIFWSKYPNPVLYADSYELQIVPSDVIKINDVYMLYYFVRQYPYYEIRLATSTDGITFTKYTGNPILIAEENWEGTGIYSASIIFENNQYKMVYASVNASGTGLGMAYSNDGINWIKDSGNPFFMISDVHNNWCYKFTYPFWRKFNDQYRIYYTGNYDGDFARIGMIYK